MMYGEKYNKKLCIGTGGWSDWGSFGQCITDCGSGVKFRTRQCDNPLPCPVSVDSGCMGPTADMTTCEEDPCPGMDSYIFVS